MVLDIVEGQRRGRAKNGQNSLWSENIEKIRGPKHGQSQYGLELDIFEHAVRKLHGRWNQYTAGRARSLLREILSPTPAKLPELMWAIEKMEDLVRHYSNRRDAQGYAHNLAEDIRSSLEALLPDDLEKHVR